ncbi:Uncharacterised protein [Morganella morganii]|nr:Uncharacterised protein [Morganella morganii]
MHALLEMDSPENPLIDWEFLRRCTVGFDESNMPAGADPKKNFKDYLLGTYTGKPTTPKMGGGHLRYFCIGDPLAGASDRRHTACGAVNRLGTGTYS